MSARILVVDDILPNVRLLEAKLSSEYYDVLTAVSGAEALEKAKTESPDLILLDVMMPGMDGFEACRRLKADTTTAHIPVVMVTALTDAEDRVRGLEAGADDFLSKPINNTALMARVRSLVRLKMAVDEWRVRENTASQLGVGEDSRNVMDEDAENAKILLIEDEDFEHQNFAQTLKKDHHDIYGVNSGVKAMELIADHAFDLIIVSLNLREEDGLRLCSHLRSSEKTRAVPILMVGVEDDTQRIAQGLEMGAHDYVIRPVDRNEFMARTRTQIRRKRFQERLRSDYEQSLSMAVTDPLTGLYNRRYMETHLLKLLQRQEVNRKSFGLLIMDIDHFKVVNDTYGHNVGDDILKEFAQRLTLNLRSFDLVARHGGEEFVIILPDTDEHTAHFVAERLRRSIEEQPFPCAIPQGELSITSSLGGALIENSGLSVVECIERADKCLYAAKENGRNMTWFEGKGRLNPDDFRQVERQMME